MAYTRIWQGKLDVMSLVLALDIRQAGGGAAEEDLILGYGSSALKIMTLLLFGMTRKSFKSNEYLALRHRCLESKAFHQPWSLNTPKNRRQYLTSIALSLVSKKISSNHLSIYSKSS